MKRSRPIVSLAYSVIAERTVFSVFIFVGKRFRFVSSALPSLRELMDDASLLIGHKGTVVGQK